MRPLLEIEVILKREKKSGEPDILPLVQSYLKKNKPKPNTTIRDFEDRNLKTEVLAIIIGEPVCETPGYPILAENFNSPSIKWYFYTCDTFGPLNQRSDDDEEQIFATHSILPSQSLCDIWENLYYDNNIKTKLLSYAQTIMEFSDKGVNTNIVSCNRVILLHGPPGTGKTSLCKALAQKISIRMQDRYKSAVLFEIRTDCLFSKYFSESAKLVNKMFSKIHEVVQDADLLVCVLVDEVESLAHARDQCQDSDPSDAIKVVNAVLTQLDQLKIYTNVLVFATSNMTKTIDVAFVDRADIKEYLGYPSRVAIYSIYRSCLAELMERGVLRNDVELEETRGAFGDAMNAETKALVEVCGKSEGLSGRCLRRIPFIAKAVFCGGEPCASLIDFLGAMGRAVESEHGSRHHFKS